MSKGTSIMLIIWLFFILSQVFADRHPVGRRAGELQSPEYIDDVVAKRTNVYACPRSVDGIIGPVSKCTNHKDCYHHVDELCCQHPTTNAYQCMRGIIKADKEGDCPQPSMWNDYCIPDDPGCLYDSECPGTDKCCPTFCEEKSCLEVRQNIDCPLSLTPGGGNCTTNEDCTFEEVCCAFDDGSTKCNKGVSVLYKPGYCPYAVEGVNCRTDVTAYFDGDCFYDHECPGGEKCCHSTCNYYQCGNLTAPDYFGSWKKAITPAKRDMIENNKENTINVNIKEKKEEKTDDGDSEKDLISLLVRKLEGI